MRKLGYLAAMLCGLGLIGWCSAAEEKKPNLVPQNSATVSTETNSSHTDDCFYCGEWMPTVKSPQQPHLSQERFVAHPLTMVFPGCEEPVDVIQIFSFQESADIDHVALDFLNSSQMVNISKRTLIITKEEAKCRSPLPIIPAGSLVAIAIVERGGMAGKLNALMVSIFTPSLSETQHISPSILSSEELKQIKKILHPRESIRWELIHTAFNYCDDGSDLGAIYCANANHYEADGKLNEEWRLLRGVLPERALRKNVAIQKKWLTNVRKHCQSSGTEWNSRLTYAIETNCEAELLETRATEIMNLNDCVSSKKSSCSDLTETVIR